MTSSKLDYLLKALPLYTVSIHWGKNSGWTGLQPGEAGLPALCHERAKEEAGLQGSGENNELSPGDHVCVHVK